MSFIPVIISGGSGSRLWPLSRDAHPKPFIELPDGSTLIGKTYKRAAKLKGVDHILTVTNRDFLFLTLDAYADAKAPRSTTHFCWNRSGAIRRLLSRLRPCMRLRLTARMRHCWSCRPIT